MIFFFDMTVFGDGLEAEKRELFWEGAIAISYNIVLVLRKMR